MWKSLTGRSADRSEKPDSRMQAASNDKKPSRSRSDFTPATFAARKTSRSQDKGGGEKDSVTYNASSQDPYTTPTAASVSSSYATADTHVQNTRQSAGTYGIEGVDSRFSDSNVEKRSKSSGKPKRRAKDRSSSRERKTSNAISKGDTFRDEREKKERKSKDCRTHERKSSEPALTGKARSSRSSQPGRAATMPIGYRGLDDDDFRFAHQFASQTQNSLDSASRPSGLAADYYGDHGESVADQPGVRPVVPSIILGPDTHLHEPTAEAAPPVEPSAMGQLGAAASFYANGSDRENAHQTNENGRPAKPSGSVQYGLPSPRGSPGPTPSPSTAVSPSTGMNASYYSPEAFPGAINQTEQSRPDHEPQAPGYAQQQYQHPSKPSQWPLSGSSPSWADAAAAASATYGLPAHAQVYSPHTHHDSHYNSVYGYPMGHSSQTSLVSHRHRHRGPLSRIANFFKDPEAVGQYEEYTEILGVCKYCFDPGSSPKDAPRKHHYKRRLSRGSRYGSSTRVDKLNRYASSEEEKRKKSRNTAPLVAAGVAGFGLAQAGKSLAKRKDFDDTYSVQSGRVVNDATRHPRDSRDNDRSRKRNDYNRTEYGIAHAGSQVDPGRSRESYSDRLHGLPEKRFDATDRQSLKDKTSRRTEPARVSPRSSYVSLTNEGQSGYSTFFSAPSANHKSHRRKKKKGLFTFHNSSSSSSDLDLAFGAGHVRRRENKRSSRAHKDEMDLSGTMLGLGAATAALAAANSRQGRSRKHGADLVAVKETRPKHQKQSEVRRRRDSATSGSGADSAWEDASDGETGTDSALAYGHAASQSRESLVSNGSGTEKWAWRWGGKPQKSARRDSRSRPVHGQHSPPSTLGNHQYTTPYPQDRPTESAISSSSLQQVYPMPTDDPNMFDVARNSSNSATRPQRHDVPYVSQAVSLPLKQPQPITPATAVLNGGEGSLVDASRQSLSRDRNTGRTSITAKPGQFLPNETISESPPQVLQDGSRGSKISSKRVSWSTEEPKLFQGVDDVSTARAPKIDDATFTNRRGPARERSPTVTFDLPQKELEREQRATRRRSERRRADSYSSDHSYPKEERPQRHRPSLPNEDDHLDHSGSSDKSKEAPRRRSEENLAREEELERQIRQLVEEDQSQRSESKKKSSTSWVAPVATGAAGAGFAAVAAHAMSKSDDSDKKLRRVVSGEWDYPETASDRSSIHDQDYDESKEERKRRTGKIKLPRSTSSPVYDNYGSYFTPPELSEHLQEHNIASERRNSTEDRTVITPQIVEVAPASPPKFPLDLYEPFGSRAEHNAERLYQPIPRLNLMEPSPPVSIAGSVRGDETPTIIAVEPTEEFSEEILEPAHAKEPENVRTYQDDLLQDENALPAVDRSKKPNTFSEQPQAQTNPLVDEPMSPKTRAADRLEDIPHHASGANYGEDLGFAAALAAGAQDAGFDPSIVIDNPAYHKRDSPPGSDRGKIYQAPFVETVSDFGVSTRSSPPPSQIGFVEGEVESPGTERFHALSHLEHETPSLKENHPKASETVAGDHLSKAPEGADPPRVQQAPAPKVPGDFNVFDYFEGESPSATTQSEAKHNAFESLGLDEALSRVSWSSPKAAENGIKDAASSQESGYRVNGHSSPDRIKRQAEDEIETEESAGKKKSQEEPDDFYAASSRKKTKRKSKQDAAGDVRLGDVVEEATRGRRNSRHVSRLDEDIESVAASAPDVNELNEARRSKKSSKKHSRGAKGPDEFFDDTLSMASSPAKFSNEKDVKSSGKDKGSGGIFSMFGAVQALSTQKDHEAVNKEVQTAPSNEAGPDDSDTPKKKSKKSKKEKSRESTQELEDRDWHTQSTENQPLPRDETNSFLGERPEMPMAGDTGASGLPNYLHGSDKHESHPAREELIEVDPRPNFNIRSRSASPRLKERNADLPPISFGRPDSPTTPQTRSTLSQRRLSALQIGDSTSNTLVNSSPTAVPLVFRRPPISPGHSRHGSATSPGNESPETPQSVVRSRQPRPNSTEFKHSKEFRPLFLVERHSYKHEPEVTETYPSLPSSRTSSAHPSVEDLRADLEDKATKEPPDWFGQPPQGDKRHSWSSYRPESPDYLDSQQTTPTATEFPKEVKKPKPKYEFHSPSELLQELPPEEEKDEPPMSPMLLPESVNSTSLEHSSPQNVEVAPQTHPDRTQYLQPSANESIKHGDNSDIWKNVGLAAAVGAAGTAMATMVSDPSRNPSANDQNQKEHQILAEESVGLDVGQVSKEIPEAHDHAVTGSEKGDAESLTLQNAPAKKSKKSKKKNRKSVGFVDDTDELRSDAEGPSQRSMQSQGLVDDPASLQPRGLEEPRLQQPLTSHEPSLSLDSTNNAGMPETEPKESFVPVKGDEAYSRESLVGNDYRPRSSSPHVHWPEGSSAAQSLEYDPLRSTQNIASEGIKLSNDEGERSLQPEDSPIKEFTETLPELTPLPITDDSDLLEPLDLEKFGADSSPLSIAFERAKAARGFPAHSDLVFQDDDLPTIASRDHPHQDEGQTAKHSTAVLVIPSTTEDLTLTSSSADAVGKPKSKEPKRSLPNLSDKPTPERTEQTRTRALESPEIGKEKSMPSHEQKIPETSTSEPEFTSGHSPLAKAGLDNGQELPTVVKSPMPESVTNEPAALPRWGDNDEIATGTVEQEALHTSSGDSTIGGELDSKRTSKEMPQESFWPMAEKNGKKKKGRGRMSSFSAENDISQFETSPRVPVAAAGTEKTNAQSQVLAHREDSVVMAKEPTSVTGAENRIEKSEDSADWALATKKGKKAKKAKGNRRTETLPNDPISSRSVQPVEDVEQPGSSFEAKRNLEEEQSQGYPLSSTTSEDGVACQKVVKPTESADGKDSYLDEMLEEREYHKSSHMPPSMDQVPMDLPPEDLESVPSVEEKPPTENPQPPPDSITASENPEEDPIWASVSKGKKSKKKRQNAEIETQDPSIQCAAENGSSFPENASEIQPTPSRKQSKKDKKKKKAFVSWGDDNTNTGVTQQEDTLATEEASKLIEHDATTSEEMAKLADVPNTNQEEVSTILEAETTRTKPPDDSTHQEAGKAGSMDMSRDDATRTQLTSAAADTTIFKNTETQVDERAPIPNEHLTPTTVHETSLGSQPESDTKAARLPEPRDMNEADSNEFVSGSSSIAPDIEPEWTLPLKKSKKDKKHKKKQPIADQMVEMALAPESTESKTPSSEIQDPVHEPNLEVDKRQEASKEEPEKPVAKSKKGKKKKRQTIDWTEELPEPSTTSLVEQQSKKTLSRELPVAEIGPTDQAIESPISQEFQDLPLETPGKERSQSVIWATPVESTIEKGPQDAREALNDGSAFRRTIDTSVLKEANLPATTDQEKNQDELSARKNGLLVESYTDADKKDPKKASDPQSVHESQPMSEFSKIRTPFKTHEGLLKEKSPQDITENVPKEALLPVEDLQSSTGKISDAVAHGTEEIVKKPDDETSQLEEASESVWPVTLKKAKKDRKKKMAQLASAMSPVETPVEQAFEPLFETQAIPGAFEAERIPEAGLPVSGILAPEPRAVEVPDAEARALEPNDWTELPKKLKKGQEKRKPPFQDDFVESSTRHESLAFPLQLADSLHDEEDSGKQRVSPSKDWLPDVPVECDIKNELREDTLERAGQIEASIDNLQTSQPPQDNAVKFPSESAEVAQALEEPPPLVYRGDPTERGFDRKDLAAKELREVAAKSSLAQAEEPEELFWTTSSKRSKKKGKGKRATDVIQSETFESPNSNTSNVEVEGSQDLEQTTEEVKPDEFAWNFSSQKGKKQKKKTKPLAEAAIATQDPSESARSALGGKTSTTIHPLDQAHNAQVEDDWRVSSKKHKKSKKNARVVEDEPPAQIISESPGSSQEAQKPPESLSQGFHNSQDPILSENLPRSDQIDNAHVEDVWQASSKKDKKSKKFGMAEDELMSPINSKSSQEAEKPLVLVTPEIGDGQDLPISVPPPAEDDEWSISDKRSKKGKKGKQGKRGKETFDLGREIPEPSLPKFEKPSPSREQAISPQQVTNDVPIQLSPVKDIERTDQASFAETPAKGEIFSQEEFDTNNNLLQSLGDRHGNLENDAKLPLADIVLDKSKGSTAHTDAKEDKAIAVNDIESGDDAWLSGLSRKQSKKDKKQKRAESVLVSNEDNQPDIAKQEARESLDTSERRLPSPPEEPSAIDPSAAQIHPSRDSINDPTQVPAFDASTQDFEPIDRPESSVTDIGVQESMDKFPVAESIDNNADVDIRTEYFERMDQRQSESKSGEGLPVSQSATQDVASVAEVEPEFANINKRKKDKKKKKARRDSALRTDDATDPTESISPAHKAHPEEDWGSQSFKAVRHVEPSIQKAIQTLEGAQRRSSTSRRRSSSPSANRHFRDSAMQMLELSNVENPVDQLNRDSGYIPSPVMPEEVADGDENIASQATRSRPLRPITPTSSSEDLKNDTSRSKPFKRSVASDKSPPTSGESDEDKPGLKVEVEVSPDYEVSIHPEPTEKSMHQDRQSMSSPPLSPRENTVETAKALPQTPTHQRPSQIDSTSKDRSSGLFNSSPSMRTSDPNQTPQSSRKSQPFEASGLHGSPSVHSRRSAELLKQHQEAETEELSTIDQERESGQQDPVSRQARSIFGGPIEREASHQKSLSPPRMALGTIPEDASSVHHEHTNAEKDKSDDGPSKGVGEIPLSQKPWPKLGKEQEASGSSPQQPSKPIGGELPATPEDSGDEGARDVVQPKGAKALGKRASFPTSIDLRDANLANPASSSRDPVTDKGHEAPREMADSYDGWGANPGSPMSPTRPPSIRKRQSMQQIQDLQAKVEQLASENRLLATAKITAEKNLEDVHFAQSRSENASQEAMEVRELRLRKQDEEIHKLRENLEWVQNEVSRLKQMNDGLTATNVALTAAAATHDRRVADLSAEQGQAQEQWRDSTKELEDLRAQHEELSTGMEGIVRHEIEIAVADREAEIKRLNSDLEIAKGKIRELQQQLLAGRSSDELFTPKDADYFEAACQQLCQHVQAWVKRFSKYSDTRVCRLTSEVRDEKIVDRFENAMLDDYDVNKYLADRVRRRDVFMSIVMEMIWNHVFTRYLFGMDREQRQKLKSLEKILTDIGPPSAVRRWRSLTLTLLTQRESFKEQRAADTEAVVLDIYRTLAKFLPPPSNVESQILDSLRNVMRVAVDLSIEMRKQRAEYTVLPPLQPEYDTNGDLAQFVYFNAALMNERSGETTSNEALESQQAIVRIVLFPLVVKKGSDNGEGDEEFVVCPAQVLIAKPSKDKKVVRIQSGDKMSIDGGNRSVHSFAPSSMDMGNVI